MHKHPLSRAVTVLGLALLLAGCGPETPQELVAKGKADLQNKDARSAVIRFKTAMQAEPNAVATRALLGRALVEADDPRGALVELNRALEQRADPSDVMPWLARAMNVMGQSKKLIQDHAKVNLSSPQAQADFKTQMAMAYAAADDKVQADATVAEALKAVPNHAEALTLQLRFLLIQRRNAEALAAAEKFVADQPKVSAAWYLKGEALIAQNNDRAGGEQAFRKAIELDASNVLARSALVVSRIREGDMAGGKKELAALQQAAPANQETIFLIAQMAFFEKDFPRAREAVQLLLRTSIDNPNLLQLAAAIEWQGGSLLIAQKYLETALRVDPALTEARVNLAHVVMRLGQPIRALSVLEPLLKRQPAPASALSAAGEAALLMGDPASAEGWFRLAAEAAPSDDRARTSLAMAQLAQGDSKIAFAALESMAAQSKEGYVDSALASARLARGELDGALVAVDKMLSKAPQNASAHQLRGRILMARREYAPAREALDKALAIDRRYLGAVLAQAELDMIEGKSDKARERFSAFLAADPRNHVAITELAGPRLRAGVPAKDVLASLAEAVQIAPEQASPRLQLIELLGSQKQLKAALSAAQEAAAALPQDVQILDALGRSLRANGNSQQALVIFRRILSIDPNLAAVHLRISELHMADGNRSAALASLRRAAEIDPKLGEARNRLVILLVESKRSKEALDIAADIQRRDPKSPAGYLLEGAVHRKLLNHEASAAAYRRGLQQAGTPGEMPLNLFVALLASKNWKQAEAFALEWLAKNPADGALVYNLAEGYMMQKDHKAAATYFARAAALRPNHVPSLNNLASMRLLLGEPGALDLAREAARLAPEDASVLDTLAAALAADRQLPQALETQRRAVALAPSEPGLRLGLAKLALQAGDKGLAKAELERLAAMGSRNPLRDETAALLKSL